MAERDRVFQLIGEKNMEAEKPKIISTFSQLELLGKKFTIATCTDAPVEDSVVYHCDPDPGVTETITCTDMVCSSSEIRFKESPLVFETKLVVPRTMRFADEVKVTLRRTGKKAR